jgi:hypothetical protein
MRVIIFLFCIFASTLSFGQGAPQWFLERVEPFGDAVSNLGDSLWTTYYCDEEVAANNDILFDFFAVPCHHLIVEDVSLSDVFVIMGYLKFSDEADGSNLLFHVFDVNGHLVYHRSLGLGDLYGNIDKGRLICNDHYDRFRVAITRQGGQWIGTSYSTEQNRKEKKKKRLFGLLPDKQ